MIRSDVVQDNTVIPSFHRLGFSPSELFPTYLRNTAVGAVFNAARGVQFLTPIIIEKVSHRWGLSGGISLAAGFSALGALWVWTLPETRGRRITATERGSAGITEDISRQSGT